MKSEEDGKSDIGGFSLIESSSREVGSAVRARLFEHGRNKEKWNASFWENTCHAKSKYAEFRDRRRER
jgi:hypothetical protein